MADDSVRFRLLGPVSACRRGSPLDLRGAQPRCVLAVLLLDAGDVTSLDRLVDALWGDAPPRDPRSLLHVHISRLRGHLAGVPGVTLHTVGRHGYRLEVPDGSVDLFRFRELVAAAEAADDPGRQVELLDEALALWHGEPLGDTAGDLLASRVAPALSEDRLLAVEARLRALLRLGRNERVIPELSMLVAENPLRESMAGALMEALHGAGRTDEALAVFRDLRARLVDELGVEPSAAAQELHRAILAGQDGAARPGTLPFVVPAQLPADLRAFVGRAEQVGLVRSVADTRGTTPRVLAVTGPPGVGKSALAVHAGHLLRDRHPDGQLYASLAGAREPADAGDVLGEFLAALGVPDERIPARPTQREALYRSILAGRRVLVVLDDARDAAQVRPLLPSDAGCTVLVTSRTTLASLDADARIELGRLGHDDAVGLLATEVDERRLRADPAALDEVLGACGYLALALRVVGRRLATRPQWSVRAVADRLRDERERLGELTVGDLSVEASIRLSYRQLEPAAARAFRLLGLMPGAGVGRTEAAALLGLPERHADRVLDALRDANLVEQRGERIGMHDLLRFFARTEAEGVETDADRAAALTRLACGYALGLRAASLARSPGLVIEEFDLPATVPSATFATADEATSWLEAERTDLAAAIASAAGLGTVPAATLGRLAGAFGRFADPRGYLTDLAAVTDAAITRSRAEGDPSAEGVALLGLGNLRRHTHGRHVALEAYRDAARLLHGSGTRSEATALNNVAVCADDPEERIASLRRALRVYDALGDQRGAITALGNIADHHIRAGEFEDAVEVGRKSVADARNLGAQDLIASTQVTLSEALHGAGASDEAIELIRETLARAEALGHGIVRTLGSLAYARMLRDAGRLADAVDEYERTLSGYRDRGADHDAAATIVELGDVLDRLGQRQRAEACWSTAHDVFARLDAPEQAAVAARLV